MDGGFKIQLREDMSQNEIVSWFTETLQRFPTAVDVYEVRWQ
jgi:uncharacterized membrane protein